MWIQNSYGKLIDFKNWSLKKHLFFFLKILLSHRKSMFLVLSKFKNTKYTKIIIKSYLTKNNFITFKL